ncbi:hypothetical protein WOC76_20425 [Methylocystis sp. IM3]|uniref:hypothetical protein n=1 Tax=unclassified Methylocystis TaxID=2625913 RepID=UPI0030FB5336
MSFTPADGGERAKRCRLLRDLTFDPEPREKTANPVEDGDRILQFSAPGLVDQRKHKWDARVRNPRQDFIVAQRGGINDGRSRACLRRLHRGNSSAAKEIQLRLNSRPQLGPPLAFHYNGHYRIAQRG